MATHCVLGSLHFPYVHGLCYLQPGALEYTETTGTWYALAAGANTILLSTDVLGVAKISAQREVYAIWCDHFIMVHFGMVSQLPLQVISFYSYAGSTSI